MKPVTDALLNWMKILYTHDVFAYCEFWHHHVKPNTKVPAASLPHEFRITKTNVPNWNYENQHLPVFSLYFVPDGAKISVRVFIKRPDVLRALGDDYKKEYTSLKLKDVIDFMEVYNTNIEQHQNLEIYYINPYKKDNRINTKDFIKYQPDMVEKHKKFVDALFAFLDKREKQNMAVKEIKKDFKKE